MKYYDKMHYEEELDQFCRCIRANISIMLQPQIRKSWDSMENANKKRK